MKIRTSFVSNSSSSSFCIFGAVVPDDTADLTVIIDDTDINYEYGISDYMDQVLVGAKPWNIGINETRGSFEERVTKKIQSIFGENIKCKWYTDGGYQG